MSATVLYTVHAIVFVVILKAFFQPGGESQQDEKMQRFYRASRKVISGFPPGAVFGIVWTVLFSALTVANFLYYWKTDGCVLENHLSGGSTVCWKQTHTLHVLTIVLVWVNWAHLKLWERINNKRPNYGASLFSAIVLVLAFASAVVIAVLFFMGDTTTTTPRGPRFILQGIVYAALAAWLAYATYLGISTTAKYKKILLMERKMRCEDEEKAARCAAERCN